MVSSGMCFREASTFFVIELYSTCSCCAFKRWMRFSKTGLRATNSFAGSFSSALSIISQRKDETPNCSLRSFTSFSDNVVVPTFFDAFSALFSFCFSGLLVSLFSFFNKSSSRSLNFTCADEVLALADPPGDFFLPGRLTVR